MGKTSFKTVGRVALILLVASTPFAALADEKADCLARWLKAEAGGITYGETTIGGVPTVVVDEDTFASIDFNIKAGLAATFECAALGPGRHFTQANFISNLTHKVLAVLNAGTLEVK